MSSNLATDLPLDAFNRWVKMHYGNQQGLADAVMTSRAHLSQVLYGERCGRHTWRRLVRVLPPEGLSLLQQCSTWSNPAAKQALHERMEREQFSERFGAFTASAAGRQEVLA